MAEFRDWIIVARSTVRMSETDFRVIISHKNSETRRDNLSLGLVVSARLCVLVAGHLVSREVRGSTLVLGWVVSRALRHDHMNCVFLSRLTVAPHRR